MITIRQLLCASLALCASSLESVDAQRLWISGLVTDPSGRPLGRVAIYLEGSNIATLTQGNGRYTLAVPESIAALQGRQLVARLIGHEVRSISVVLSGERIVQDFVLPLDTARRSDSSSTMPSDGPANSLTISGRVVDSSGAGLPGVQLSIRSMGVGTMADSEGKYSFNIPLANGRTVKMIVQRPGLLAREDTVTLIAGSMVRDFQMNEPIYNSNAAEVLKWKRDFDRSAGLTDLARGPHRDGEQEIRIWILGGMFSPYFYRFVSRNGKVNGEAVLPFGPAGGTHPPDSAKTCFRFPNIDGLICRTRFTRPANWGRIWKTLDSLGIWSIPDEGPMHLRMEPVMDGEAIVAELWNGRSYRAWAYASGVHDNGPGRAKVTAISAILQEIDERMNP